MKRKGRSNHLLRLISARRHSAATTLILTLLFSGSAFLIACRKPAAETQTQFTRLYIHSGPQVQEGTLDLFFFNKDPLLTLDAYQRFESLSEGMVIASSRAGDKLVAGILNLPGDIWSWSDIRTFQRLSERVSDLTEDLPDRPVMSGIAEVRAGREKRAEIRLVPLLSRVVLQSLCCDFHARPYRDAVLEDVDVYLVNVNRTVSLFDDGTETIPTTWLNMGGRDGGDGIVLHLDRIGSTVLPNAEFWCYPNATAVESLGRPLTCLVIEGNLLGEHYYYPIGIPAIGRGETIVLDITLTRTGTTGIDIPVSSGAVDCNMQVIPWQEMPSYNVLF